MRNRIDGNLGSKSYVIKTQDPPIAVGGLLFYFNKNCNYLFIYSLLNDVLFSSVYMCVYININIYVYIYIYGVKLQYCL